MSDGDHNRGKKLQLWGWMLFVFCSLLFIASSIRNGDWVAGIASVLFLGGCLMFIVSLLANRVVDDNDQQEQ